MEHDEIDGRERPVGSAAGRCSIVNGSSDSTTRAPARSNNVTATGRHLAQPITHHGEVEPVHGSRSFGDTT